MIDLNAIYGKLAKNEVIPEGEIVGLLKELAAFRIGVAYMAECEAATLESLPKSASKSNRTRQIAICSTAVKILQGDTSSIQYHTKFEHALDRCIQAVKAEKLKKQ